MLLLVFLRVLFAQLLLQLNLLLALTQTYPVLVLDTQVALVPIYVSRS
ncbi:hypothetical protein PI125_g12855 [Phytophthora idaei]|nr:hypothetical protein PI125_g12855 [Phytophthora idaei]